MRKGQVLTKPTNTIEETLEKETEGPKICTEDSNQ